ncbi:uncharacterized protein LOC133035637 isoform X2 [Cannabis sativa]|uniref:uncharacterized protein LOC133035637 isoform X2 n=1 Tax=Cannabis sativa TaxID=3483 RepID=UPI0029CA1DE3|nr:uncharacterized protein LOC133035637 isoform X2 [Cannabis sativa]
MLICLNGCHTEMLRVLLIVQKLLQHAPDFIFRAESNGTEIKNAIANYLTYESSPKSFVGLHKIVTNIQISELTKNLQLNEKKYFWIEAAIKITDTLQNFYYMSCDACHKKINLYNRDERIICDKPICGQEGFPTPRAIAYVELDNNTKSLSAVMFADIVEKIFSCITAQLMKYTAEEHRCFVDTTIFNLSKKKWTIQIYADPTRMKSAKYKNYTIVSIEANED